MLGSAARKIRAPFSCHFNFLEGAAVGTNLQYYSSIPIKQAVTNSTR